MRKMQERFPNDTMFSVTILPADVIRAGVCYHVTAHFDRHVDSPTTLFPAITLSPITHNKDTHPEHMNVQMYKKDPPHNM